MALAGDLHMAGKIKELQDLAETISIAIARERASIEFYKDAFDKAVSENAKRVFSLLLEQEKRHESDLRDQLAELRAEIALERSKSERARN
jgi:rubrerythrin